MVNLLEKINQLTHICVMLAPIILVPFLILYFGKPLLERQRLKKLSGLKKALGIRLPALFLEGIGWVKSYTLLRTKTESILSFLAALELEKPAQS